MDERPIGIFDSGVGGISTLGACFDSLPSESFVYVADRSGMPYGSKTAEQIEERAYACIDYLTKEDVKAVVVACNTATNVGIAKLREKYSMPFVGVEPAVKPAAISCRRGNILVLLTPATASQKKFLDLLAGVDNGRFIIAPQPALAEEIEKNIDDLESIRSTVYGILRKYRHIEGVVLGCTHYVFVKDIIADFYNGRVRIFDGNDGVARRLKNVLESGGLCAGAGRHFIKFAVV